MNKSEDRLGERTPSRLGVQLPEQLYFFLTPCHGRTNHDYELLEPDTTCRLYPLGKGKNQGPTVGATQQGWPS